MLRLATFAVPKFFSLHVASSSRSSPIPSFCFAFVVYLWHSGTAELIAHPVKKCTVGPLFVHSI